MKKRSLRIGGLTYHHEIAFKALSDIYGPAWELVCINLGKTGRRFEENIRDCALRKVVDHYLEHGAAPSEYTPERVVREALAFLELPSSRMRRLSPQRETAHGRDRRPPQGG